MLVKFNKREFDITNKDIVFFNGACFTLTTQQYFQKYEYCNPMVSIATAKKWIKDGTLVFVKEYTKGGVNRINNVKMGWYRFNIRGEES